MSDLRPSKPTAKQRMTKVLRERDCYQSGADGGAEKRCSRCKKWFAFLGADGKLVKPSAFGADKYMPFGNASRCRRCLNDARQESAKRGKEE